MPELSTRASGRNCQQTAGAAASTGAAAATACGGGCGTSPAKAGKLEDHQPRRQSEKAKDVLKDIHCHHRRRLLLSCIISSADCTDLEFTS